MGRVSAALHHGWRGQFDRASGTYLAPLQMKANNGMLIIDDLGRQTISPQELLNRWIVPLDRRVDYLTLSYGMKFEIPFELLVVFATNLEPADLADEAFLRRIPNKISVDTKNEQMTLYATGVRRAELTHLKISDIDSQRMVIHIQS